MREHSTVGETLQVDGGVAWRCLWERSHCQERGQMPTLSSATRALKQHYWTQHGGDGWQPLPEDAVPAALRSIV